MEEQYPILFSYFQQANFLYGAVLFENIYKKVRMTYKLTKPEYRLIVAIAFLQKSYSRATVKHAYLIRSGLFSKKFNFANYMPGLVKKGFLEHPYKSGIKAYIHSNFFLQLKLLTM